MYALIGTLLKMVMNTSEAISTYGQPSEDVGTFVWLLRGMGDGFAYVLDVIKSPLGIFLIFIAIVGTIILFGKSIWGGIGRLIGKKMN